MKPAQLSTFDKIRLDKLRDAIDEKSDAKQLIKIPKYQRGIVWKDSQKKALLESIFKGFPIGSLLCHDTRQTIGPVTDQRAVWDLVDGLQRTSTLREFMEKPLTLLPIDQAVAVESLEKLCRRLDLESSETHLKEIRSIIEAWCAEAEEPTETRGFTGKHLRTKLLLKYPDSGVTQELDEAVAEITDEIRKAINEILTIEVPITVFSGAASDVPTIFKLVNTMGTQLTKYQVFAATWSGYQTKISNASVRAKISEKYKSYIDRGFEVQGFEEGDNIGDDEYNLYEYLYGLGQYLASDTGFGRLFPDPENDPDEAAAVAFNMVTIAYGLRINEMDKLAAHLSGLAGATGPIDLKNFESALMDACNDVWKTLEPYVGLKLNSKDGDSRITGHSLNQVISLIIRYLVATHEPISWNAKQSLEAEKLLLNIPSHYLLDIVSANWRSAGEKRLWDMVWASETSVQSNTFLPSTDYLQPVSEDKWHTILNVWYEEQSAKKQTSRQNLTEAGRAFLRFIYAPVINYMANKSVSFHIEHLYPVKVLADEIKNSGATEGWPISHIGNLCLLPQTINEKKGETLLGDFILSQSPPMTQVEIDQLTAYVLSEPANEVTWPGSLDKDEYLAFCKRRFDVQVEKLFAALNPPKY